MKLSRFRSSATDRDLVEPDERGRLASRSGDDELSEEAPRRAGRRGHRIAALTGLLLVAILAAWWLRGPSLFDSWSGLDPASHPLPPVRPGSPGPPRPSGTQLLRPSEAAPRRNETTATAGPNYYLPLRADAESQGEPSAVLPHRLAAMGWQLAVKDREARLTAIEAQTKELRAKAKEAEARIEEAEARIKAFRRNPALALRALLRESPVGAARHGPTPFETPPPAPRGGDPLAASPKQPALPPAQPERTPLASEISVRMIDASTELPEAMVTVGPASYIVRAGDQIGSWRVTGVSPNGIWINAGLTERVWRPLLTPAATHRNLSGVVPGAPATPAPALPAWEAERPSNDQARGAPK